jgi:hypothetical protein
MPTYEISCGKHSGTFDAKGPGEAWRRLTNGKMDGFAPLARYRELQSDGRTGRGVWFYVDPNALETMK